MSECGSCGAASPDGTRFCRDCGASLAVACPACGEPSPPGFRFCGSCGTALPEPGRAAPPGLPAAVTERRVCSVLFADLVGFTTLTEHRDPEEVRDLLSAYFETARTIVDRYGGMVEKFIGDALMAVWGTPVATESDAERAARAGLDLVTAIGELGVANGAPGLRLRVGVVTGEVAATIGAVGQGMVAGDAVNTAARVQSVAAPGTVLVDTATRRLSEAAIGFRSAGLHELKGKAEVLELWEVVRVLGHVGGGDRVDGLEAAMVGRGVEERTLREVFHATVDGRVPRLVVVSGPAGIGKSRLGWEFEKYVDGLAFDVRWHRGRCLSYGDGVAYWALAAAIRQRFGIAEEMPVESATAALLAELPALVPDPQERSFVGVRLGRLLGLRHPDDGGADLPPDELHAGWRLFFERLADVEPVVLLIEDAQHADPGLVEFLEGLVDWSRTSPIFVVLFARGELVAGSPGLAIGRRRSLLTLDPLSEDSVASLVDELVPGLPDDAVRRVATQAQGNPLFAVETVRSLLDRGLIVAADDRHRLVGDAGELVVPDSLHGLLIARLDALEPRLRSLTCDAAVLGSSFPAQALAAMSERALVDVIADARELVRRGVLDVTTDPLSPQRGEFVFAQPLLRQVAYDLLSRRDRAVRHRMAAEHLRRVFPADGEEVVDVVAQHYLDAIAHAAESDEIGDLREKAASCLVRAAERSRRSGAPMQAANAFRRAAELVGAVDEARSAELWFLAADELSDTSDMPASEFAARTAADLWERLGRRREHARASTIVARALRRQGRAGEAEETIAGVLEVLRPEPGLDTVMALGEATNVAAFGARPSALAYAEELMALSQRLDTPPALLARGMMAVGIAYSFAERRHEAIAYYRHSAELARQAGSLTDEAGAWLNLASELGSDDPDAGCAAAARAAEISRSIGLVVYLSAAIGEEAQLHLLAGRIAEAERILTAAVVEDGMDDDHYTALPYAAVLALRGRPRPEVGVEARERIRGSDDVQDLAMLWWWEGMVAIAESDPRAALEGLRRGFAEDFPTGWGHPQAMLSWPHAARCAVDLGDLDALRWLVARVESQPPGMIPERLRIAVALARLTLAEADGAPPEVVADGFVAVEERQRAFGDPHALTHVLLDRADHLERNAVALGSDRALLALIREEAGALAAEVDTVDLWRRLDHTRLPAPA